MLLYILVFAFGAILGAIVATPTKDKSTKNPDISEIQGMDIITDKEKIFTDNIDAIIKTDEKHQVEQERQWKKIQDKLTSAIIRKEGTVWINGSDYPAIPDKVIAKVLKLKGYKISTYYDYDFDQCWRVKVKLNRGR